MRLRQPRSLSCQPPRSRPLRPPDGQSRRWLCTTTEESNLRYDRRQNNYKLESKLRRRATHSAATNSTIQVHFHIRTITYHYLKTSNRSRNIVTGPYSHVTSTHIRNGCWLAPVTYKRVRTTPGLASTTPVTNVDFW
jgi:hypothetical protein